ncbi:MAG: rRNA maturation RNase YbeY [Bacillota bacterium]|nr:rRNA maturation RNase YbeY [Bacillota bacterium]
MKGSNIPMIIQFVNRQSKLATKTWQSLIRQVLPTAIPVISAAADPAQPQSQMQGSILPAEPSVTVIFAGPIVMRRINRETRGIDRLTDVLSFPLLDMQEGRLVAPLGPQDYDKTANGWTMLPLGDIVIAPDIAMQQAKQYGHSVEREMAFLAVHGLLHLLGYDHDTDDREKNMMTLHEAILQPLGLNRTARRGPELF